MAEWCWFGMGLCCLAIGATVALLALLVWLVVWLIKAPQSPRAEAVAPPPKAPPAELAPAAPPTETPVAAPQEPPVAESPVESPVVEASALACPFITYESRHFGRVTIHRRGCWAIEKKSGGQRHEAAHYVGHDSYEAARTYADGTGLTVHLCGICKPETK